LFGGLALLRPDLGLLFVPLLVPLYLIPAEIQGLRADPALTLRWPTYEIALLLVCGATATNWLWRRRSAADRGPSTAYELPRYASQLTHLTPRYAPHRLFLFGGVRGVVVAAEPSRALREFRWLIAEPLMFYALLKSEVAGYGSQAAGRRVENQELQSG